MTRHGEEQAMGRDGGVGVSDEAMANAVANPRVPPVVQSNGGIRYEGEYATVILNQEGKVITTWAINKRGWRVK
jgi:hypothetical protein